MAQFIDIYGLTVTEQTDGSWLRSDGLLIADATQENAAATFDAMAPNGWVPPAPPPIPTVVPASITNFQCRSILLATPNPANTAQSLFEVVNNQITAMAQTSEAYQAWEYANDVTRNGALVTQFTASLGLTSAQVDALFIAASAISA